jgi:HSP20 family protein
MAPGLRPLSRTIASRNFEKDDVMKTKTLPTKIRAQAPFAFGFGESPFAFLRRVAPNVDRLFDEMPWPYLTREGISEPENWLPKIDVFERDGTFILRADLPGMTRDNVKVEVKDNLITIEGERKSDFEEDKDGVYRLERVYGTFFRAVPLPEGVKAEDVKATFKDGVLEVTAALPAAKLEPKARFVEILEPGAKAKAAV